jgi:hypothetical protein
MYSFSNVVRNLCCVYLGKNWGKHRDRCHGPFFEKDFEVKSAVIRMWLILSYEHTFCVTTISSRPSSVVTPHSSPFYPQKKQASTNCLRGTKLKIEYHRKCSEVQFILDSKLSTHSEVGISLVVPHFWR